MGGRQASTIGTGGTVRRHDLHGVAGWEVPREAMFVCRAHATRAQLEAEFGADQIQPVTWLQVELAPFRCAVGDHDLEPERQEGA